MRGDIIFKKKYIFYKIILNYIIFYAIIFKTKDITYENIEQTLISSPLCYEQALF